jgi:hypothetical protein
MRGSELEDNKHFMNIFFSSSHRERDTRHRHMKFELRELIYCACVKVSSFITMTYSEQVRCSNIHTVVQTHNHFDLHMGLRAHYISSLTTSSTAR